MGVTKRDFSGVFTAVPRGKGATTAVEPDCEFQVTRRGITFVTDTAMTDWTEVGVKMEIPESSSERPREISCRAVVVRCEERVGHKDFEVLLFFLDLPRCHQQKVDLIQTTMSPLRVSIVR